MKVKIVYDNPKDKELIELVEFSAPFFIEFIDTNTKNGRKEAYKIKSQYGAKVNPFIEILDDNNNLIRCFWSEYQNACQLFVNTYKNDSKN